MNFFLPDPVMMVMFIPISFAGDSDTSSTPLGRTGTDSDSDAPLINLVSTQNLAPSSSNEQGAQNILELLGNQTTGIKGPEVNPDVSALLSVFFTKWN